MPLRARTFHILCSWSAPPQKYSIVLIVCMFSKTTMTINMFTECCKSGNVLFLRPPPPHQVKVCISACPNSGGGAPVVSVRITTSNVVLYFQLMGLFLHRQSFSPWGICSLCVKSFATVPLYSPSIWRHLANERQALWRFSARLEQS